MEQHDQGHDFWWGIAGMVACGLLALVAWTWAGFISLITDPELCENNADQCGETRSTLVFSITAAILTTAAPFLIGFRRSTWAAAAVAAAVLAAVIGLVQL